MILFTGGTSGSRPILSLKEARELGEKRYFSGKPCQRGHVSERLVSNMGCIECAYQRYKAYYHDNAEQMRERNAVYKDRVGEKLNAKRRESRRSLGDTYRAQRRDEYQRNAERERTRSANWRQANKDKVSLGAKRWQQKNKHLKAAYQMRRVARGLLAEPSWADHEKIAAIYKEAKEKTLETGIPHEVDHYYPLMGKNVCGLHVDDNLRVIPASENRKKNNKFPGAM